MKPFDITGGSSNARSTAPANCAEYSFRLPENQPSFCVEVTFAEKRFPAQIREQISNFCPVLRRRFYLLREARAIAWLRGGFALAGGLGGFGLAWRKFKSNASVGLAHEEGAKRPLGFVGDKFGQ
jgi:hypothetical protein